MRISSYAVARPAYYDRNATTTFNSMGVNPTPHSATVRFTTTVASGKKMLLETTYLYVARFTVATAVGEALTYNQVTAGASTADVYTASLTSNTVGAQTVVQLPTALTLYAGEVITAVTSDASTDGTCLMRATIKGTTYDA